MPTSWVSTQQQWSGINAEHGHESVAGLQQQKSLIAMKEEELKVSRLRVVHVFFPLILLRQPVGLSDGMRTGRQNDNILGMD